MDSWADCSAEPWRPLLFSEDGSFRWRLAGAEISLCRRGNCWDCMTKSVRWEERRAGSCAGPEAVPADVDDVWIPGKAPELCGVVWGNGSGPVKASLSPRMEEKPFLVCPREKLRIFPGMEVSLETALPPVLEFRGTKDAETAPAFSGDLLFTLRPFILKETWFGATPMKGMLCLSLPADTPGKIFADSGGLIGCTVFIRNKSKTVLELEKFPLHAAELSLYQSGGRLLSETPVIDAYGNGDFQVGFRPPRVNGEPGESRELLAAGNKSDVWDALFHQGSRIIKHITGL